MFIEFLQFFFVVSAIGSWVEFARWMNRKVEVDDADR